MKAEKTIRSKKKGEKTKQNLLDTAALLFGKYDFHEVTVDAIVEAAGVAKGTFYIYFESKDAMIAALLKDYVSGLDLEYKSHLDLLSPGTKSNDIVLSLIEKIASVITDSIGYELMRTVYKIQLTGAVNMDAVMGYNRELYKMFSDVIDRGIERGEFNTGLSVDLLAKHFVMAIRGLCYEWCIRYPNFNLREQALAHFGLLLDGISIKN